MRPDDYRRPPEAVDMAAEKRSIRRGTTIATAVILMVYAAAFWLGQVLGDLRVNVADRLTFAVPGFVLMVAVLMVPTTRRFSPEDIGGQAAGPPSERMAIKAPFLQNTLEQVVVTFGSARSLRCHLS